MAIRSIIFDMGRVLVHFSHDEMFAEMGRVCGATGQQIREWLWDSGLEDRFERGEIDAAGVRDELQRQVETEIDVADLMRAASDIFTLNEPLMPVLERLRQAGYRLIVLSNTCPPHVEWIGNQFSLRDRFDDRGFSYEVGTMTPSPEIYRVAGEAAGCEAARPGCRVNDESTCRTRLSARREGCRARRVDHQRDARLPGDGRGGGDGRADDDRRRCSRRRLVRRRRPQLLGA